MNDHVGDPGGPIGRGSRSGSKAPFGALIGDWLLPQLNIHLGVGIVALIINALIGAIVLLLILRLIGGRGWRYGRRW